VSLRLSLVLIELGGNLLLRLLVQARPLRGARELLVVSDLLELQKPIEEQRVHVVDKEIAELDEEAGPSLADLHEALSILPVTPDILHEHARVEAVARLLVKACPLRIDVDANQGLHEVLAEGVALEEAVFVHLVLSVLARLMMLALSHEALRNKVDKELDHLSFEMRVLDPLVENHADVECQLHVQVYLLGKIALRVRLAEDSRHHSQVLQHASWYEGDIHWRLLAEPILSGQREHLALEDVDVGEELRPLLLQSEEVPAVVHRNEEAAGEGEQ